MTDEVHDAASADSQEYQPGKLRAFVQLMRAEFGDDKDLIKQALADLNAEQRQNVRNHFEGRVEYARQVANQQAIAFVGIREYGLQTLKWLFLLNAGAIAIVLTYISGSAKIGATMATSPLLHALWPFAVGCVLVVFASAAAFFNFSYAEASMPSPETLNNFLDPKIKKWPLAKFQNADETPAAFRKRFSWKIAATRNAAIVLAGSAAALFAYGVYRVLSAALIG
jgi:hypothetical protein